MEAGFRAGTWLVGALAVAMLSACDLPYGLGSPTTRSLESGAAGSLTTAKSFEITGSYSDGSTRWEIDLQVERPTSAHLLARAPSLELEAIVLDTEAFFRGQQFLSAHMGSDLVSRSFVEAAGNGWWKSSAGQVPQLADFTDGDRLRSTFLGQAATRRIDHVVVDGVEAVNLSGRRADVFIAAAPPYRVLRLQLKPGVVIDGIRDVNFRYGNYDKDFQIAVPASVIDFSNLSTLPAIHTVLSVDTSGCGSPCTVSALVKNLGGPLRAPAPVTVTFTMTDPASHQVVATCQAPIPPSLGYNATATVACTVDALGTSGTAVSVTAVADNPARR